MKPEIKRQWVEALRSGDYRQGHGVLHRVSADDETFCCLGVLCELARKASVVQMEGEGRLIDGKGYGVAMVYRDDDGASTFVLPRSVRIWAGLSEPNPELMYKDDHYVISDLNDGAVSGRQLSFEELADVIEAQL